MLVDTVNDLKLVSPLTKIVITELGFDAFQIPKYLVGVVNLVFGLAFRRS